MQLLPVFSFFLTVHSLAIEQRSCVSSDVVAVAQQATDPHYFCAWYLSDGRTKSPIQNIGANALLKACKCITSVEPAGANAKNLDAIAKAARLQSFVSATCSSTSGNPISKEFKDSSSFCSFFNSLYVLNATVKNRNTDCLPKRETRLTYTQLERAGRQTCLQVRLAKSYNIPKEVQRKSSLDLDQEIKLQVIFVFEETGCENLVNPVRQIKQQAGCQDFLEQDFHYQVIL
ncbi:hypothetical protein KCV07_g9416, partial [Aureobasidium melanogenum]